MIKKTYKFQGATWDNLSKLQKGSFFGILVIQNLGGFYGCQRLIRGNY